VCNDNFMPTDIEIGQGETRSIIFKIKTDAFVDTDTLLFAMRNSGYEKTIVKEYSQVVSALEIEEGKYNFIVNFSETETTALPKGLYLFDLTLINEYGQKKRLTKSMGLSIVGTIGASMGD